MYFVTIQKHKIAICFLYILIKFTQKNKKKEIRSKNVIEVAFILYDLATWKSENLYLSMLKHCRFNPIIAITKNTFLLGNESKVIEYVKSKKYEYVAPFARFYEII